MAPKAPMAPPSVGVAIPKKIVPNTKKIKINGGIKTKVTCSANLESKPSFKTRLAIESVNANKDATVRDIIKVSSPGLGKERSNNATIAV